MKKHSNKPVTQIDITIKERKRNKLRHLYSNIESDLKDLMELTKAEALNIDLDKLISQRFPDHFQAGVKEGMCVATYPLAFRKGKEEGINQEFRRILDLMIEIETTDKFETFLKKWNDLKKQLQSQETKQSSFSNDSLLSPDTFQKEIEADAKRLNEIYGKEKNGKNKL